MKKFIILIILTLGSIISYGQYDINPQLKATAQEINALRSYNVNVFVDTTSDKTLEDIKEIIQHVNNIYSQVRINFTMMAFTYGNVDYNPYLSVLTSIRSLTNSSDLSLYITGRSNNNTIGAANTNCIGTVRAVALVDLSNQLSNKDCSGVVVHEIGHLFGLYHGFDSDYIMSEDGNLDYCSKFTEKNLEVLKNYK